MRAPSMKDMQRNTWSDIRLALLQNKNCTGVIWKTFRSFRKFKWRTERGCFSIPEMQRPRNGKINLAIFPPQEWTWGTVNCSALVSFGKDATDVSLKFRAEQERLPGISTIRWSVLEDWNCALAMKDDVKWVHENTSTPRRCEQAELQRISSMKDVCTSGKMPLMPHLAVIVPPEISALRKEMTKCWQCCFWQGHMVAQNNGEPADTKARSVTSLRHWGLKPQMNLNEPWMICLPQVM